MKAMVRILRTQTPSIKHNCVKIIYNVFLPYEIRVE